MAGDGWSGTVWMRQRTALLLLLLAVLLPALAASAAPDAWRQARKLSAGARGLLQLGGEEEEEEEEEPPPKRRNFAGLDAKFQKQVVEDTAPFRPAKTVSDALKPQVYTGPNIEEATFDHFHKNSEQFKDADRIYLPIFWVGLVKDGPDGWRAALQKLIAKLDTRKKYWTVVHTPGGLDFPRLAIHLPQELDLVAFSSGGLTPGARNVIIPLLKAPVEEENPPDDKDIRVSFIGSTTASPTRKEMAALYGEDWFFYKGGAQWKVHLGRSNFTVCPVGFGQASFRLAEAIALETIPVYVWESVKMLPYTELFDWTNVAILVHSSKVDGLGKALEEADEEEMRDAVRRVKALFTYEAVVHYIAAFVNEDRDGPFFDHDGTPLAADEDATAATGASKALGAFGGAGSKAAGGAAAGSAAAEAQEAEEENENAAQPAKGGSKAASSNAATAGGGKTAAAEANDEYEVAEEVSTKRSRTRAAADDEAVGDQASPSQKSAAKKSSKAGGDGFVADQASSSATPGAAGVRKRKKGGALPADQASTNGTPLADADAVADSHQEKVRAKQRVSGAASLVQSEGGLDRSTAVENAKTIMEPQDSSSGRGAGKATTSTGVAAGGGDSLAETSKANSKRVAEVTAALASNGAKGSSSADEATQRRKGGPGSAAAGSASSREAGRGGGRHKDNSIKPVLEEDPLFGGGIDLPGAGAAEKPVAEKPKPAGGDASSAGAAGGGAAAAAKSSGAKSEMVWDSKAGKRMPKPQANASAGSGGGSSGKSVDTVWDAKAGKRVPKKKPDTIQK